LPAELQRHDFNYHLLDKKVKFSLQKYYNRMCYRPTPFGMFSAFTSLNWCKSEVMQSYILLGEDRLYINPDFQLLIDIAEKIETLNIIDNLKYYSNNSIYRIKNERRYLTYNYDKTEEKNLFFISSFKSDRLLNKIIVFCKNGKTKAQLTNWLNELIGLDDESKNYINDLIDAGILVSELNPNMSGKKYFERIADIISENAAKGSLPNSILKYKYIIDSIKHEDDVNIKSLTECSEFINCKRVLKSKFYVGYEKKTNSLLNIKYQQYIKEGLNCLDRLTHDTNPKSLTNFKNRFITRFENQEIPLLVALDREAGVGYEGLESNLISSGLLNGIHLDIQSNNLNFRWTSVHEFFLSKLSKNKDDQVIIISDKDLEKLEHKSESKMPPSFSVIFRIYDDKIWIEQAGGCTATSLLGRFTQFNAEILAQSQAIDLQETELNQDVLFVDISCFNDEHSANINSNAGVRQYEIPIGVHSTLNRNNIINLSDITVSVINDQIIIRSKKLNKIIIPRLSSAYNYTRSDLSIYRFLCDLQYQGLKSNYSIDLKSLLPGLNFYPRVEYKNCILFPATWILNTDEITELKKEFENTVDKNVLYNRLRLKKNFALTEGDNQLYFDCDDHESVQMFMQIISNKSSLILQEAFIDPATSVKNTVGQPLCGQFITSVISNNVTYAPIPMESLSIKKSKTKRIYLPGDEWVYFKLYSHPSVSNNILLKTISKIINGLRKQNILKCWYFIRYIDTGNHLRVRVLINRNNTADVIQYFERSIRVYFEKGSVSDLLLDTYKREVERYGAYTIEYAERMFEASSDLVVNFLKKNPKTQSGYYELHLALLTANIILEVFLKSSTEYINLLNLIHESMKHEFEDSKAVKVQLDNKYREHSAFINNMNANKKNLIIIAGKKEFSNYIKTLNLLKTKTNIFSDEKLNKLVADLLHMHLNRIFTENHRKQEFIIYYLLYKHHLSLEARRTKTASLLPGTSQGFAVNHINKAIFK
jgi:thiopeptide-type bacteriocin biosynthesis protein